jgi:hypothetical protein
MQHIKQAIQFGLLFFGLSLYHIATCAPSMPISQFAHCVAQKRCEDPSNNTPKSLACCKGCLSATQFNGQNDLQEVMQEHLDLVCTQFHRASALSVPSKEKPFSKMFLIGAYEHASGKDGCNRDRIMWTAPINLYQNGIMLTGSTATQNGIIRVYPLARCEDRQIGDVLSNDQLQIKVSGKKMAHEDKLNFTFNIAKTSASNAQHTQLFVELISELASLSFNSHNQALKQWSLMPDSFSKALVEKFTTNDEANERGWKGKTEVFIQSVKP